MAYRTGSVTTYVNANLTTTSFVINSPVGVQQGDLIIIGVFAHLSSTPSTSCPGFTSGNGVGGNGISQGPSFSMSWLYKVAGASEPASYTVTCLAPFATQEAFCAAWTGRAGTIGINTATTVAGSGSPVSIGLTGGTASAGDDLIAMATVTDGASAVWTPPSGFTTGAAIQTATPFGNAYFAYKDNVSAGATGTITIVETGVNSDQLGFVVSLPAPSAPVIGALPQPGPGVSPSWQNQFHVPIRDNSSPNNKLTGLSSSVSTSFGTLSAAGSLAGGDSYSTSVLFGQMTGAGAPSGNSYAVSISYGVVGQSPVLLGYIPKGGPGVGPSSFFQFSTMELDTTTNLALSTGFSSSVSTAFGQLTGIGGALGMSVSVSTVYQSSITGVLTGQSVSVSTDFGQLVGARAGTGNSYSVSTDYGAAIGLTLSLISGNSYSVSTSFGQMTALTLSQIFGESLGVSLSFGAGFAPPPPGTMRVMAVALGDYKGIFRNVGDVFDILVPDYSPWNVSIVPPGNPVYPLFGWMMAVAPNTTLVDYSLSSGGASTQVQATTGTNQGGQKVYGNPPNQLGEDEVE